MSTSSKREAANKDNSKLVKDLETAKNKLDKLLENDFPQLVNRAEELREELAEIINEARDQGKKLNQDRLNEALAEGKDIFSKLRDLDQDVGNLAHQLQVEIETLEAVHSDIQAAEQDDSEEVEDIQR